MMTIDWYIDNPTLYAIYYRKLRMLIKSTNPEAKNEVIYLTE